MKPGKSRTSPRKPKSLLTTSVRRPALIAAALVAVVAAGVGYLSSTGRHARSASASGIAFCAQNGTGYCLNDWNGGGLGNQVKMYGGGATNESFALINANVCGGNHYVTSTCPFSHSDLNSEYNGHRIYEIEYTPTAGSLCVGSKQFDAKGYLEYCGGANRGYGVIMISAGTEFINRYWSDQYDSAVALCSGGVSGGPVYLNGVIGGGSCNWLQTAQ